MESVLMKKRSLCLPLISLWGGNILKVAEKGVSICLKPTGRFRDNSSQSQG